MANALSVRPRTIAETPTADEVYVAHGSENDLKAAQQLVILIHGFHNSPADAAASFESFRRRVDRAIPAHELWEFHWPGDHPRPWTSLATYGIRLGYSGAVGRLLGEFLLTQNCKCVRIVAHSLGCRVALETMRAMGTIGPGGPSVVRDVFLLAAAVPVPLCDGSKSRFPRPLGNPHEHVFHSGRDLVLRSAFPRGQRSVGKHEEGRAVGLYGDPGATRWTDPWDAKLGHGKYWSDKRVSREILQRMGIATSPRSTPERGLAEAGIDPTLFAPLRRWLPRRKVPRR
jgi:Alpha/beta hydrolase of unknown function (DUF900)